MRLAVVSPFVDRRHGTERALAELLERLAHDHPCEIHLYSQRVEDLALGQPPFRSAQQGGIIWHKVPSIPGPHLLKFCCWLFLNALVRLGDRVTHGFHFDLVLSPGINCFDADVVLVHALFHRLRDLARDEANPGAVWGMLRRSHRRAYYSFLTWLERRIYADPHLPLAAVSSRTAALLASYFQRDDVCVIPNGVDPEQFSPDRRLAFRAKTRARYKFQKTDFVLLLMGNDWRNKGLSTVLEAMSVMRGFPLRLLVAGQDAAASVFFEAAQRLGLSQQCRWDAVLSDPIHLYAAADAYVSPTREDSFGLPVLEAMACGLPVITSIFAGVSQILTDGVEGFVLNDPGDAAALAVVLRNLQEQADLRLRLGMNARSTAEAYTWERHATEVWEFLKQVLSKKHAAAKLP